MERNAIKRIKQIFCIQIDLLSNHIKLIPIQDRTIMQSANHFFGCYIN